MRRLAKSQQRSFQQCVTRYGDRALKRQSTETTTQPNANYNEDLTTHEDKCKGTKSQIDKALSEGTRPAARTAWSRLSLLPTGSLPVVSRRARGAGGHGLDPTATARRSR